MYVIKLFDSSGSEPRILEGRGQVVSTLFSVVLNDQNGGLQLQVNHTLSQDEISTTLVPTPNAEIDEKNFRYAKQNILQNNFQSRIHPLLTKPTDSLIPLDALNLEW